MAVWFVLYLLRLWKLLQSRRRGLGRDSLF